MGSFSEKVLVYLIFILLFAHFLTKSLPSRFLSIFSFLGHGNTYTQIYLHIHPILPQIHVYLLSNVDQDDSV